ncbi:MAG: DAK2 domain-containing protein [Actinomycetes bacterium]
MTARDRTARSGAGARTGDPPRPPQAKPAQFKAEQFEAAHLRDWSARAMVLLTAAQHDIDALNVFPVPDGDTGTNLLLTWQAAAAALDETGEVTQHVLPAVDAAPIAHRPDDLAAVSARWARGALLGARGNSGVIVAQFLRGMAEAMAEPLTESSAEPTTEASIATVIAAALSRAAELGYAGVARPVEGTILTVAAAAAAAARQHTGNGPAAVVVAASEAAADALARTPQQLPVLAAAGVVDAGGQGLVLLLEALRAVFDPLAPAPDEVLAAYDLGHALPVRAGHVAAAEAAQHRTAGDGAFEVMYLLETDDEAATALRRTLDELGASVVVVGGGGLWNVHVHTDNAGPAVEVGVSAGRVFRIRITPLDDNLHDAAPGPPERSPELAGRAVVAVVSGPSLAELFQSVGAHVVVGEPGRRPTPGALVAAAGHATEVLLLPNDDDHLAVADAAAVELRAGGVNVAVLRTHAVVQGLAAVAVHDPDSPFTDDVVAMSAAAAATRFGGLAQAERQAMTSAGICQPGQTLGIVEGDIVVLGDDGAEVATAVVDRMLAAGGELVTLICGDAPFSGRPAADAVRRHLHRTRLDVEVVVYDGGQPHYPLFIGVE